MSNHAERNHSDVANTGRIVMWGYSEDEKTEFIMGKFKAEAQEFPYVVVSPPEGLAFWASSGPDCFTIEDPRTGEKEFEGVVYFRPDFDEVGRIATSSE